MIYEITSQNDEPLRQGDILYPLPLLTFDPLNMFAKHSSGEDVVGDWLSVNNASEHHQIVQSQPVYGIVANQDCDAQRTDTLTCFLVRPMNEKELALGSNLSKQVKNLIKWSRSEEKKFYLPIQNGFFDAKQIADFQTVISINRQYIQDNVKIMRKAQLNEVARKHYRQRVGEYFWRYSYDEWYFLNKDEFDAYENKDSANRFEWQK